jgi:microcystin-dependent protein
MLFPFIGEVVLYPYNFAPFGWLSCAGQLLQVSQNTALAKLLGTKFGGDGRQTFGLPNYQSVSPQSMQYCIALTGILPGGNRPAATGEISLLPYQAPSNWFECDGQLLIKADFPKLFQVIGTEFGGYGVSTFGVPDLSSTPPPMPTSQSIYSISASGVPVPVEPFLGEIRLLPYSSPPNGWSTCQGQLLPVGGNTALFSLLGINFGGDGTEDFALPDLSNAKVPSGLQYLIAMRGAFPPRN